MNPSSPLERLVELSRELGRPENRLSIIAEGNVSADLGDGTFYVKGSGGRMQSIDGNGFTRLETKVILDALDQPERNDLEVQKVLEKSRVDPTAKLPSIETFLHALCLKEGGAKWVGHTHPVSVVGILASKSGTDPFLQHVFPDSIVICGRHLAMVPYADPGIQLAIEVRRSLRNFIDEHGISPKVILMRNHGVVALGQTESEVLNITLMLDKWASVLLGTYTMGGPQFLDASISHRIENRPDEHYRRKMIRHFAGNNHQTKNIQST